MTEKLNKILEFAELNNVSVFSEIPKGWTTLKGAMTAPKGSIWIYNRKSAFSSERETGLLLEEDIQA